MRISARDWENYISKLSKVNKKAAEDMQAFIDQHGMDDMDAVVEYAYALATKYGEASGELACEMYDAVAEASGVYVPPAEMAPTASYVDTAKAVRGTLLNPHNTVPQTVGRLVKQTGADTTLKNALRDGAKFAWIPHGETCAFCLTLASRGWQNMSRNALRNGHAEHIHANCNCEYAISFDKNPSVEGYDPDYYLKIYKDADGVKPATKIKNIRRMLEDASAKKNVEIPSIPVFKPGKSISEVENLVREFVNENRFGAIGVSFKGVDLGIANEVAGAIHEFCHTYDVEKLGGIMAPAKNTKLGKMMSGAIAGYSPIRHSLLLNKDSLKSLKVAEKALLAEKEAVQNILAHPERYDLDKLSRRVRKVVEQSRQSGRGIVAENVRDCINHELGHSLEKKINKLPNIDDLRKRAEIYAPKISGYATDSFDEYIAESFAAYCRGETHVDPEMVKAFESMRRK